MLVKRVVEACLMQKWDSMEDRIEKKKCHNKIDFKWISRQARIFITRFGRNGYRLTNMILQNANHHYIQFGNIFFLNLFASHPRLLSLSASPG